MHFRGRARNAAVRRDRTCCSCSTKDDTRTRSRDGQRGGSFTYYRVSPCLASARRYDALVLRVAFGSSTFLLFRRLTTTTVRRTAPIMQTRRRVRSFFLSCVCEKRGGEGGRSFNNRGCAARVKVQYRISEERYCNARSEKSFYTADIKHPRTSEISALRNPVNNHRSVVINTLQSVIISSKTSFRRNLKPMMKLLKYFQLTKL